MKTAFIYAEISLDNCPEIRISQIVSINGDWQELLNSFVGMLADKFNVEITAISVKTFTPLP